MERRTFLKTCTAAVYSAVGAAAAIPVLRFLLVSAGVRSAGKEFLRAVPVDSIPTDHPARVTIVAPRRDAYVQHPPGPIGSVWLSRDGDRVRCLQSICPHLGCGIDFSAERNAFSCPCHASEFDLHGQRRFGPSLRDMDQLPCRISEDASGRRWVEVQYAEFETGSAEQRPLA